MLGALEDLAAIGALALEHAARIVQAVAEHMQIGLVPGHEFAVVPDDPFEPVIGLGSHDLLLLLRSGYAALRRHDGAFSAPIPTLCVSR